MFVALLHTVQDLLKSLLRKVGHISTLTSCVWMEYVSSFCAFPKLCHSAYMKRWIIKLCPLSFYRTLPSFDANLFLQLSNLKKNLVNDL